MDNLSTDSNNDSTIVKKGFTLSIRARIDTLLIERGLKWADIYNELGWSKSFASIVRNGKVIPPNWQRVALAKAFNVDTSVIWNLPEIQSADKLKGELHGAEQAPDASKGADNGN